MKSAPYGENWNFERWTREHPRSPARDKWKPVTTVGPPRYFVCVHGSQPLDIPDGAGGERATFGRVSDLFLRDARVSRRATPRDAHTRAIVGVPSADDLDVGRHEQREVRRPARSSRPRLATLGAGTDHSRRSVFSRGEARECDAETSPLHLRSSLQDDAPRGQSSTSDGTSSAQVSVSVRSARLPIPVPRSLDLSGRRKIPPSPRFLGVARDEQCRAHPHTRPTRG